MKKNISYLGFFGVLLGLMTARFILPKYGESLRVQIMIGVSTISILCVTFIIYKKKYLAALGMLSMVLPLLFMTLGVYLDNLIIGMLGLLLLFILIPIMIRIISKLKK